LDVERYKVEFGDWINRSSSNETVEKTLDLNQDALKQMHEAFS
jgi:hypothetical protein